MIEELGIKTLDDVDVSQKRVLVRVDFNSPIDVKTGKILDETRIRIHAEKTIRELVERGAKTVILAHQGRRGDPDFTSLKQHGEILSKILNVDVGFVDDIFGEKAKSAIAHLRGGEVLLLENVRMWDGETKTASAEEHSRSELVASLAPLIDVFVVDAFAAAHRKHASLIGFAPVVEEVAAGRVMEAELKALFRVREKPEKPCVYILGGAKAEDSADIVESVLSGGKADYILTGGLVANLFLRATGVKLGGINDEILEKRGFVKLIPKIEELLSRFEHSIMLPSDLAVDDRGIRKNLPLKDLPSSLQIKDIGESTIASYGKILESSKTVVMNGPMGVFEEEGFARGTLEVFRAIAGSQSYSLIGGGHTVAAAAKLGYLDKFSHVSTGGGALIEYLVKGTLPVVEVLKRYSK